MSLLGWLDSLLAPAPDARRTSFLRPPASFAHRGLHGGPIIENSRAAFEAAIAAGHGIECDVQASRDGEAFIFHDYELDRLTGAQGAVRRRMAAELERLPLSGTSEMIPRLTEILELVGSRVPLLIEIKAKDRRVIPICLAVHRCLADYRGEVAVMSFNPDVGRWFALNGPRVLRGLVMTDGDERGFGWGYKRHLALWRSKPHFLAYDVQNLPNKFAKAQLRRGMPLLSWTVRDAAGLSVAKASQAAVIFERPAAL